MKPRVAGGRCVALAVLAFGGVGPAASQPVIELPATDRHIEAELEEVGRIGEGRAGWDALTLVTSLSFDAAGRLYVGDVVPGRGLRILVVTASGDLLDEFGGSGRGPGEFGSAMEAVALAEGGVAVPDPSRGGYHIFDHLGAFLRSVPSRDWAHPENFEAPVSVPHRVFRRGGVPGTLLSRVRFIRNMTMDPATMQMTMVDREGP